MEHYSPYNGSLESARSYSNAVSGTIVRSDKCRRLNGTPKTVGAVPGQHVRRGGKPVSGNKGRDPLPLQAVAGTNVMDSNLNAST